jgi:broad specificity phosphatase PhoE
MKIYLVRHGESTGNLNRTFCGHTDVELTPNGVMQAQNMAKLFENIDVEKIYSSPLKRAHNTAMEISKIKNMDIEVNDLLKEINFGVFEGLKWDEIEEKYPEDAKKSIVNNINFEYKNGENYNDVLKRVTKFFQDFTDNSIIVAHGALIRIILSYFKLISDENIFEFPVNNCDVIVVDGDNIDYLQNLSSEAAI